RPRPEPARESLLDLHALRAENAQLRQLCAELEQALHEATQPGGDLENRLREFEALVEEKSQTIRELHAQVLEARRVAADLEAQLVRAAEAPAARPSRQGPLPREEELLALSEELERERRQIQEDEQTLMEQMREMEVGMAKERAEL